MAIDYTVLQKSLIFRNKTAEQIRSLLERIDTRFSSYQKNELIFTEGDTADKLGIVMSGQIEVQKIYPNGKAVTVSRFSSSSTIGEAVLFSRSNKYPATVVAAGPAEVLLIPKGELLKLFTLDTDIMAQFMENMSERLVLINQRIEILSLGTLRQRIAYYLLKESRKQKSTRIRMPFSKRIWAEHLNSARPSLSRELCYMRDQGWIAFHGNDFELLDIQALEHVVSG